MLPAGCVAFLLASTGRLKSVAKMSPIFGTGSVVFVRFGAPSLEGDLIFPGDKIGFADRGVILFAANARSGDSLLGHFCPRSLINLAMRCWCGSYHQSPGARGPEHPRSGISCIMGNMGYMVYVAIIWIPVKGGLLGKSQRGHYFIYKNLDLETGSNRWFGSYNKFGGQGSLIIFSGFDSLEDAQASCEIHARDTGEAL